MALVIWAPLLQAQQTTASVDPPGDAHPLLQARGEGVQIYTCTQTPQGLQWILKAPDAKLLDTSGKEIGTHFAGPTWKLEDGGQVQGELLSSRPAPEAGAVAWLLLRAKAGSGEGSLAKVTYIQRTDTHGGAAVKAGCQGAGDVGRSIQVPYTANYTFYTEK